MPYKVGSSRKHWSGSSLAERHANLLTQFGEILLALNGEIRNIPIELRNATGSDPSAEDPAEVAARDDARYRLAEALAALPERERTVLVERSGFDTEPRSLTTISKDLGVSRERARQQEGAALRELRNREKEWGLEGLAA